jgi:hypothetical protein
MRFQRMVNVKFASSEFAILQPSLKDIKHCGLRGEEGRKK